VRKPMLPKAGLETSGKIERGIIAKFLIFHSDMIICS
jgi:hypothetical protein